MNLRRILLAAALTATLALAACGTGTDGTDEFSEDDGAAAGEDDTEDGATNDGDNSGLSGDLTVFAAASLNVAFEDIAAMFTQAHPEASVTFSFAGSSDLVAQLDAGAPADVLATANESTMADAVQAGTIEGEPVIFADNVLTLITPAGNPAGVTGLDESLNDADLVVCAPHVPCGEATGTLTESLDVALQPVSEENSVTDVLGKVTSGQAEAGLVYTTDAATAGEQVEVIEVYDQDEEATNHYPIAITSRADRPELAAAWIDFVLAGPAQAVLDEAGFGTP